MNPLHPLKKLIEPVRLRIANTVFDTAVSAFGLDEPQTQLIGISQSIKASAGAIPEPLRDQALRTSLRLARTAPGRRLVAAIFEEPQFGNRTELAAAATPWLPYFDALEAEMPGICIHLWVDLRLLDLRTMVTAIKWGTTYWRAAHAFSALQKRPTCALPNQTRPGSAAAIVISVARDGGRASESTKPPIAVLAIEGLVTAAALKIVSRWHPEASAHRSSRCGTGGAAC